MSSRSTRAIDFAPLYPEQHALFNSGRVGSGWRGVDRDVILALLACDEGPASVEDAPAPRRWWQRWRR